MCSLSFSVLIVCFAIPLKMKQEREEKSSVLLLLLVSKMMTMRESFEELTKSTVGRIGSFLIGAEKVQHPF
jgi:hypothetical protein